MRHWRISVNSEPTKVGVGTWLHMQAAYDAWHADVSHVKALKAA